MRRRARTHGTADLDEPLLLAVDGLADLRLLLRTDRRIFWRQESVRAAAHPVEPGQRQRRSSELQRRTTVRPDRARAGGQPGWRREIDRKSTRLNSSHR